MKKRTALFILMSISALFFFKTETTFAITVDVTGLCFSPNGGCTRLVVSRINQAARSIKVMSYSFTSAPISKALVRARNRGVDVQIVMDRDEAERQSYEVRALLEGGVPLYADTEAGIFHDKVMIIDGNTVITGSMNWTKAGEHLNAENLIVLKSKGLAAYYIKNFQLHEANSARLKEQPSRSKEWFFKKW